MSDVTSPICICAESLRGLTPVARKSGHASQCDFHLLTHTYEWVNAPSMTEHSMHERLALAHVNDRSAGIPFIVSLLMTVRTSMQHQLR